MEARGMKKTGFYDDALDYFKSVQEGQIAKGRAKYPEDLNPDSWTALDLIDHAMQEAVDQVHYLTALRKKLSEEGQRKYLAGVLHEVLGPLEK